MDPVIRPGYFWVSGFVISLDCIVFTEFWGQLCDQSGLSLLPANTTHRIVRCFQGKHGEQSPSNSGQKPPQDENRASYERTGDPNRQVRVWQMFVCFFVTVEL